MNEDIPLNISIWYHAVAPIKAAKCGDRDKKGETGQDPRLSMVESSVETYNT